MQLKWPSLWTLSWYCQHFALTIASVKEKENKLFLPSFFRSKFLLGLNFNVIFTLQTISSSPYDTNKQTKPGELYLTRCFDLSFLFIVPTSLKFYLYCSSKICFKIIYTRVYWCIRECILLPSNKLNEKASQSLKKDHNTYWRKMLIYDMKK